MLVRTGLSPFSKEDNEFPEIISLSVPWEQMLKPNSFDQKEKELHENIDKETLAFADLLFNQ